MRKIVIFGAGGLASEVFDWLVTYSEYDIEGFYVDPPNETRVEYPPIYSDITKFKGCDFVVAVGNTMLKEKFYHKAIEYGLKPCPPLFFNCTVGLSSRQLVDLGTVICPSATITSNVTIGKGCTININCTIGHDTKLGDFVTVMPTASISGNVTIGNKVTVGCNACIREKLKITDNVFIGMGAVVVKDILEEGIYVGNPARRIK